MKFILILFLLFSFSAFAGEPYNSGIGSISPQQQYAIDTAIRDSKARTYNLRQQRKIPAGETNRERKRRIDNSMDEYYESLAY